MQTFVIFSTVEKAGLHFPFSMLLTEPRSMPILLEKINSYANEKRPVIFECVNILPHLAKRNLYSPGVVPIGDTYENIARRNMEYPRWGKTEKLQKLEARDFFNIERLRYKAEAEKYGYPVFETADEALYFITLK